MRISRKAHKRFQIAMRALCFLSFMYVLGVAGNSDLGLEPSALRMTIKLAIGVSTFGLSAYLGGLMR